MNSSYFLLIFSLFLTLGCHSNEDDGIVVPENNEQDDTISTTWTEGFPLVYTGYHTLKIAVSVTKPGKVYYVVSEKPLEDLTVKRIKEIANHSSKNVTTEIIAGVLVMNVKDLIDTSFIELEMPSKSRNCFSYFVAEELAGDSTSLIPDENIVESVNYLPSREREEHYFSDKRGKNIPYLFYALEDFYLNPTVKYPLLVFLHGKGEYGNGNGLSFYKNGIIPQLIHEGADFPFVIVAPQIDTGRWDTDFVDEFIDHILENYSIDKSRIYMTGNSLGGVGTWEYAGDYPDRLAAMVPISGEGDTLEACRFKDVPVWAFHNAEDGIMDIQGSISMVEAMKACEPPGKIAPILTIYPDKGHNAWIRTYNGNADNDIYSWMLSYRRSNP